MSRSILEKGAWEEENVAVAMKAMDYYQDAVFIGERFILSQISDFLLYRCRVQHWDVHHHDGRHEQEGDSR